MTSREVENEATIYRFADALCRYGLRVPALITLEASLPGAFLLGQLIWVSQPVLGLFFSRTELGQIAQLMEDPVAVNHLIAVLEDERGD